MFGYETEYESNKFKKPNGALEQKMCEDKHYKKVYDRNNKECTNTMTTTINKEECTAKGHFKTFFFNNVPTEFDCLKTPCNN
ncbi:hypothetical protein NQ314_001217 [Rhamnusium bicolor]|uniref:Uncharacterized protein n=1 Tax=Rhamnusium bicolor TaxID=1586634 RepID=A0AAV8ZSD4_9CUCU|nr:hypothetical protein NQ314_001217 [Rhamnusium bicolor]